MSAPLLQSGPSTYVGGSWVEGSADPEDVFDPGTGELIASILASSPAEVATAVMAAQEAFEHGPWPRMSPGQRQTMLLAWHSELVGRRDRLIELARRDAGATVRVATSMQVDGALPILAEWANRTHLLEAEAFPIRSSTHLAQSQIERSPLGVCAAFTPFNFPLSTALLKIGPALAMGNPVVMKPSPLAPLTAIELAAAADAVGLPPGVFNVVHGGKDAGESLASHPLVRRVAFTGSTAVGSRIFELGAKSVKRLALELGGKAPIVVLDDADLDLALPGALYSAFIHSGQICMCGTRLLVPRPLRADIEIRLRQLVSQMRIGHTEDPATDVGPVISLQQVRRLEQLIAEALSDGATLIAGGRRVEGLDGYYLEPTILGDVTTQMRVARELFGPVLVMLDHSGDDEAVALANDTDYGLAATVWGTDLTRARAVALRLQASNVIINNWGDRAPALRWGR